MFDLFIDIIDFGPCRKKHVFSIGQETTKNNYKSTKMIPRADFVVLTDRQGSIFGQEVPGAALRARTSEQKNDRGAVGGGSDTLWAIGPAN